MSDHRPTDSGDIEPGEHDHGDTPAGDLLASRALDGELTADELRLVESDGQIRARLAAMTDVQTWLRDVPVDPLTTAAAVATALAADTGDDEADDRGTRAEYIAPVVPLTRRRLPVWLGAAAAIAVVVAGTVVLTRGPADDERPVALEAGGDPSESDPSSRFAPTDTFSAAADPSAVTDASASGSVEDTGVAPMTAESVTVGTEAGGDGTDVEVAVPVDPALAVVTVDLGDQDPDTEPFPMPAADEIVQIDSDAEVGWLGRWAVPFSRAVSRCRDGATVLLPQALFGGTGVTPVLVEVVLDVPVREVLALALEGCDELASALVD